MQTLEATIGTTSSRPPVVVRRATALWAVAVGSGIVETLLVVVPLTTTGGMDAGLWAGLAIRAVVYTVAALLVVAYRRRRRYARTALTVLLSGVGLASMVVPAVAALAAGAGFLDAVGSGGVLAPAFAVVRVAHVAAVVAATVTMFLPGASAWYRGAPVSPRARTAA
ncbi:hypothetical protein [Krasilnikoviella flava]|uniref:Uncharacterized protein n=1 Tax=Krasilnikoviella flava TaxID=526729 RepID=A0A1T5KTL7_9MICO|nr:hypothetical protein [Krasilnikoviella flava]SKC67136.1 hypothetical protein SAMN04324258_2413 [Krasilnikoviella flava]